MADQDRRGDHDDHAWAELTWTKLLGFVIKFGFIPGFICGCIVVAIGTFTDWYWLLVANFGSLVWNNWWLGPFLVLIIGIVIFMVFPRKRNSFKNQGTGK